MQRTLAFVIAVVLTTPAAGLAQQPDGAILQAATLSTVTPDDSTGRALQPGRAILQSAERAAVGMELQSDAPARRRSEGRTWAGVGMVAVGTLLASSTSTKNTCNWRGGVESCTSKTKWWKPLGYYGIGLAATGALLATVLSDVPAHPRIDSDASGNRRSMARTWTGVSMIAVGGLFATARTKASMCISGSCTTKTTWIKSTGSLGVGLAAGGVLLATVLSDVPVNRHIDLAVTPDRIQVGKTFKF